MQFYRHVISSRLLKFLLNFRVVRGRLRKNQLLRLECQSICIKDVICALHYASDAIQANILFHSATDSFKFRMNLSL